MARRLNCSSWNYLKRASEFGRLLPKPHKLLGLFHKITDLAPLGPTVEINQGEKVGVMLFLAGGEKDP